MPLATVDPAAIETLLDRAFGRDRHGRTAYRLRDGAVPVAGLSMAMRDPAGGLIGSLQSWPLALCGDDGIVRPLILVGPVAVDPAWQGRGVGSAMMRHLLEAAGAHAGEGGDALAMIGDPEYYGRFGFDDRHTAGWRMPGPWEPRRLLARLTGERLREVSGMLARR